MAREGMVLGHLIFEKGIEVDRAKIEVIEQLPPPVNVKGIRRSLSHVGFYRRFVKDFHILLDLSQTFLPKMFHLTLMMLVLNLLKL
jgi:hypothetical protein